MSRWDLSAKIWHILMQAWLSYHLKLSKENSGHWNRAHLKDPTLPRADRARRPPELLFRYRVRQSGEAKSTRTSHPRTQHGSCWGIRERGGVGHRGRRGGRWNGPFCQSSRISGVQWHFNVIYLAKWWILTGQLGQKPFGCSFTGATRYI